MPTLSDKILIGVLLLCSIAGFAAIGFTKAQGSAVVVHQNGKVVGRYPLSKDREIAIEGPLGKTYLHIKEGAAWVVDSPCPQKTCVRIGGIRRAGEMVVCVPNRVLVRIEGNADKGVPDAISR